MFGQEDFGAGVGVGEVHDAGFVSIELRINSSCIESYEGPTVVRVQ